MTNTHSPAAPNDQGADAALLLSRGLDVDLNRREMRQLYRLLADDAEARDEARVLAALEDGLDDLAADADSLVPNHSVAAAVMAAIRPTPGAIVTGIWQRLGRWLGSPRGISLQPLSFASGVVASALVALLWLSPEPAVLPPEARLAVSPVQFKQASARVDWTYQFIVSPGGATRIGIDVGDDLPVLLQLESSHPVPVTVRHQAPQGAPKQLSFTVDGIGYAELQQPKPGDTLVIHNNGSIPIVVYAYTNGYGGAWVLPEQVL